MDHRITITAQDHWLRKSVDKALELKDHGNALYKEGKIKDSVQIYTKVQYRSTTSILSCIFYRLFCMHHLLSIKEIQTDILKNF